MKLSRADRSLLAEWSFTIDRSLLIALVSLVVIGVVLSAAASPAVAVKKGLLTYYFVERHLFFAALGTVLMIVISFFVSRRETSRSGTVSRRCCGHDRGAFFRR